VALSGPTWSYEGTPGMCHDPRWPNRRLAPQEARGHRYRTELLNMLKTQT